ncbi:MAG: hypothetical protein HQL06_00970 [Nitrospirae bacterium]|nr:hypothetical protein [Nitrospirota bacterium]
MDKDKLTVNYTLRITPPLKQHLDSLTEAERVQINEHLRIEMARKIHAFRFNPKLYIEEGDITT